jgi:hypothetical protein
LAVAVVVVTTQETIQLVLVVAAVVIGLAVLVQKTLVGQAQT